MAEEVVKTVDEFLVENGYDISLVVSSEDKIKLLQQIAFNADFEKDMVEINYDKKSQIIKRNINSKKDLIALNMLREEFLTNIQNLEIIEINAKVYINQIKFQQKEKRRFERKENFQKALSKFKKR